MGRLTKRYGNTYVPNENANYEPMNCMDKLGRLEDLEEQGRLKILSKEDFAYWTRYRNGRFDTQFAYCSKCDCAISSVGFDRPSECPECGATMVSEAKLKELEGDKK